MGCRTQVTILGSVGHGLPILPEASSLLLDELLEPQALLLIARIAANHKPQNRSCMFDPEHIGGAGNAVPDLKPGLQIDDLCKLEFMREQEMSRSYCLDYVELGFRHHQLLLCCCR